MVFLGIFIPPLILEGFGIGLEIDYIPHILTGGQYLVHRV
jgi:hypothetical protein